LKVLAASHAAAQRRGVRCMVDATCAGNPYASPACQRARGNAAHRFAQLVVRRGGRRDTCGLQAPALAALQRSVADETVATAKRAWYQCTQ